MVILKMLKTPYIGKINIMKNTLIMIITLKILKMFTLTRFILKLDYVRGFKKIKILS
jgi:hypothetical protein